MASYKELEAMGRAFRCRISQTPRKWYRIEPEGMARVYIRHRAGTAERLICALGSRGN